MTSRGPTGPGSTGSAGPRYGTLDREYGMRLATTPTDEDGPVWMVNLMKYRQVADYADGRESTISGREADDRYAPLGPLAAIGAEVVFVGDVDEQLVGASPTWDRIGVVKYPTRRSFIDMQSRPDFRELHAHKDAGMQQTFVIGCQPFADADGAAIDVGDAGVTVVDALRFVDGAERAPSPDEATRGDAMWFAAEGTILGDGRTWDQVRFTRFPSRQACRATTGPAIADAYSMVVRPVIDRLRATR